MWKVRTASGCSLPRKTEEEEQAEGYDEGYRGRKMKRTDLEGN
jgi:hypothetical protein